MDRGIGVRENESSRQAAFAYMFRATQEWKVQGAWIAASGERPKLVYEWVALDDINGIIRLANTKGDDGKETLHKAIYFNYYDVAAVSMRALSTSPIEDLIIVLDLKGNGGQQVRIDVSWGIRPVNGQRAYYMLVGKAREIAKSIERRIYRFDRETGKPIPLPTVTDEQLERFNSPEHFKELRDAEASLISLAGDTRVEQENRSRAEDGEQRKQDKAPEARTKAASSIPDGSDKVNVDDAELPRQEIIEENEVTVKKRVDEYGREHYMLVVDYEEDISIDDTVDMLTDAFKSKGILEEVEPTFSHDVFEDQPSATAMCVMEEGLGYVLCVEYEIQKLVLLLLRDVSSPVSEKGLALIASDFLSSVFDAGYGLSNLLSSAFYEENEVKRWEIFAQTVSDGAVSDELIEVGEPDETIETEAINSPATPNPEFNLESELSKIIGLDEVKQYVRSLQARLRIIEERKKHGLPVDESQTLHMVFTGNPGTGKTMMARTITKTLASLGVIKTDKLVETDRAGLVGEYVGETAIKTTRKFEEAQGGILFIDEAYTLSSGNKSGNDYGREAIDTLVKLVDDHRDKVVVILAGYTKEMKNFFKTNPGLISRFPNIIEFSDYSTDELMEIAHSFYSKQGYILTEGATARLRQILDKARSQENFGNGRFVRNVYEHSLSEQAMRLSTDDDLSREELITIKESDIKAPLP